MGVDYRPLLGVGKVFDDEHEAVDWFFEIFPEASREKIDKYGLEECLDCYPNLARMRATTLNCYTGDGFVIHIPLHKQDIDKFSELLVEAREEWRRVFNTEPDIVYEVSVS